MKAALLANLRLLLAWATAGCVWEDDPQGFTVNQGICNNVVCYTGPAEYAELHAIRARLFKEWPEYSGDLAYPVPCIGYHADPNSCRSAAEQCFDYYAYDADAPDNMWTGEYGAARIRLLTFMIAELEKMQ